MLAIAIYREDGPSWRFAVVVAGASVVAASSVARFHTGGWRVVGVSLAASATLASFVLAYKHARTIIPSELSEALDAIVPSDAYALTDVSIDAGRFSVTAVRELDTNMSASAYDAWVTNRLGNAWRSEPSPPVAFVRTTRNDTYSITLEHRDHHVRVIASGRAE